MFFFFSFCIINTHFTAISQALANVSSLSAVWSAKISKTPTVKVTAVTMTMTTVTAVAFTGHWPIVDGRSFQGLRTRGTRCCCCGCPTAVGSVPSTAVVGRVDGPGSFWDTAVTDDGVSATFEVGGLRRGVGNDRGWRLRRGHRKRVDTTGTRESPSERVVVTVGNTVAVTQSIMWSRSPRRQCNRGLPLFTGHRTGNTVLSKRRAATVVAAVGIVHW